MNERTMKFTDDNGNKVEYAILDQKLINNTEYVTMAPVNNKSDIEVFKIKFDKEWNETLVQVESEAEKNMVKQVSTIKY